jgi:hypothetical protein
VVWQHVLGVACVLCAVQNESVKSSVNLKPSFINSAFVGKSANVAQILGW